MIPLLADKPYGSLPKFLAVVLALGGGFWGLFVLFAFGATALIPLPFGVGYAVTAAYVYRALWEPSYRTRRRIWLASLLVQGTWLLLAGLPLFSDAGLNPFSLWWLFATGCSVVGLTSEPPDEPVGDRDTNPDLGMAPVAPASPLSVQR